MKEREEKIGRGGEKEEKGETEIDTRRECDLTHTAKPPSLHNYSGSPAHPKKGDLKGWIREGEIASYTPIFFLHSIIQMHFIHKIPTMTHTVRPYLGRPCQRSSTPHR